jgi:hypothetical protein
MVDQATIDRVAAALEGADIGHSMSLTRLLDGVHTYTLKIRGEIETLIDNDEADAIDQVYTRIREVKHRLQAEAVIAALNPTPAPEIAVHPDDEAVDRFAAAMKAKLAKKRAEGRGGWEDKSQCSNEFLSKLLLEHIAKGDPVDVGNLSMMIHQRGERVISAEPVSGVIAAHKNFINAWESLPGDTRYSVTTMQDWISGPMKAAVDRARSAVSSISAAMPTSSAEIAVLRAENEAQAVTPEQEEAKQ